MLGEGNKVDSVLHQLVQARSSGLGCGVYLVSSKPHCRMESHFAKRIIA